MGSNDSVAVTMDSSSAFLMYTAVQGLTLVDISAQRKHIFRDTFGA